MEKIINVVVVKRDGGGKIADLFRKYSAHYGKECSL